MFSVLPANIDDAIGNSSLVMIDGDLIDSSDLILRRKIMQKKKIQTGYINMQNKIAAETFEDHIEEELSRENFIKYKICKKILSN